MSPSPDRRLRIMLLFGGQSAEHDVSRVSAVAVARALDPDRYDVVPVAITREGRWLLADQARAALESGEWPSAFEVDGAPVRLAERRPGLGSSVVRLESGGNPLGAVDVAFPLLHGPYGEDGTVQGLLELAGLPYVGSGVLGSAVGMDKVMMKRAFMACGLATPRFVALRDDGVTKADLDRCEDRARLPLFREAGQPRLVGGRVEGHRPGRAGGGGRDRPALRRVDPRRGGRSPGGRSRSPSSGTGPPEASLPGEIVPGADFYTYEDKYLDDSAELRAPTDLDPDRTAEVRRLAVAAFEACRVRGHGPGRLLPGGPGAGVPRQRGQHDPRVHADLDVPPAVGGHRRALPRAPRPARGPGARAPRAPGRSAGRTSDGSGRARG